ncbi:MAG: hypothetical protein ACLUDD_05020 [Lactobacillus kalixensis]|uniref:hypothetical protein n=1 Tax=Lactobacillus kalixensis TaxID=227944 RepID=UPI0039932D45
MELKKDSRLTIVDLPKTRKQIQENNRLTNRIERGWRNSLNEFWQPKKAFNKRESALIAVSLLMLVMSIFFMLR